MSDTREAPMWMVWDGSGRFWASTGPDEVTHELGGWLPNMENADSWYTREDAQGIAEKVGGHVISEHEAEAADKPIPPKVVKPAASEDAEGIAFTRDHFAGQALAGYLAAHAADGVSMPDFARAAKWAYGCADAMIAERAKPRKQG